MTLVLALLVAAASANCDLAPAEIGRQLKLSYQQFDTGGTGLSWRQLNADGCTDSALRLLALYEATNAGRLSAEQRNELAFHQGQALAFAGRDTEAIPYFKRALEHQATDEWASYVAATLAFLRRDAAALRKARGHYAAIAPGSMRLKVIDGFMRCPSATYVKAVHCSM